ncbi:OTU (ovarian tumor)-like cysteine protease [Phaffia rhodozyma]|uniref:OTU (Ovarian tumor)-like cysteine protease n=1 Tax=Phaffia rhodozyma TaxID=264483 RepID=A0A0F7SYA2_PHARH|nr:OTU (ovarian tumor)-like cysteine protease [Phaffia rhodozyma]
MFKRASYLRKTSGSNTPTSSASNGDGPSPVHASSQSPPVGSSSPPTSGGFLSRVRQASSRTGMGGGSQKLSPSPSQTIARSSVSPVEGNAKNTSSPIMPSLFRVNTLPGISSARPSFDNSSVSSFSSVSTSSSLERERNRDQNENGHADPHDPWDHDHGEREIRVPLFGNTATSSAASSIKDRPRVGVAPRESGTGKEQNDQLIDIEPSESERAAPAARLSSALSAIPQSNGHPNVSHSLPDGDDLLKQAEEKDSVGALDKPVQAVTSSFPPSMIESPIPIPLVAPHSTPIILVDTPPEVMPLARKNNPFGTPSSTPPVTVEVEAPIAAALQNLAPSDVHSPTIQPAPGSYNGDSVHPISKHHHHHVHRSEGHTHSPPAPDYPPIRAATLSGIADVATIANGNGVGKKRFINGKTGGGFMSGLSRKFKDPKAEGALALASLPPPIPAPELSPQAKIDRAKQAERAHLLQICMELGVEIYDIAPDGNCLYGAIADQLYQLKKIKDDENNPRTTRAAAADYMLAHPDSFMPFLIGVVDPEETDDDKGATDDGMMTAKGFEKYCARVRSSTEWGGEPEILALSRYYQIPIHVIQSNHPKIVAHSPDPKAKATLDSKSARKIKAVRISYHRRLYGLGEHYNSLRKITYQISSFSAMVPM